MDERETLGKYLKNQRESKKISLREVSKNTRVREYILKAIEEDQADLLPAATYVKGFLLAYAKYLRLDPNDVLLRYERGLKGEPAVPPSPQPVKSKQKASATPPSKPKQKISWSTKQTWVVVGVIVASFVIFFFFSPYSSNPPVEPLPEKSVEEKPAVAPSPPAPATTRLPEEKPVVEHKKSPTSSSPVAASTSVQEKKPFSVALKAAEETWVSLQVDDQPEKEMTFKPRDGISVQAANRIRMKLGNAGGVDLALNGKPLGKFGKSGEVVTLVLTPQGVEVNPH
ncbi:MAG: helix-turn-helix domain-containing protein [bacterium]